jgi:sulfate adenylyltransferase subunit 1 (EFTu-like GTPase family)
VSEFEGFAHRLGGGHRASDNAAASNGNGNGRTKRDIAYIPISALNGDNVVERSEHMPWYDGPPLLQLLENVEVAYDHPDEIPARMPVQWVIRPSGGGADGEDSRDYRGYAGQISSGALRLGDEVAVLPSGGRTQIAAIDTYDGEVQEALAPMSVTLRFSDELDVSRGELISRPGQEPTVARELEADVCWMSEHALRAGGRYLIKHTTRTAGAIVDALIDRVDVDTLERTSEATGELTLNDIGRVRLRTSTPLAFDPYALNRRTGSFVLIDEASNETVAAGMIVAG